MCIKYAIIFQTKFSIFIEFQFQFQLSYSFYPSKINFFNLGFRNRWQKLLPHDIKVKMNEKLKENFEELGYLDD